MGILFTLHIIVAILLIVVILIQQGRGGGLIESLGGAETIFGTKTSSFFVRLTAILASIFFITSLSLNLLSKKKAKSVIEKIPAKVQPSKTQSEKK